MSTKIYNAWRFPHSNLADFIDQIHAHMMEKIISQAKKLMEGVDKDYHPDKPGQLKKILFNAYILSKSHYRIFNFDCGVNLYPQKRWIYALPYGGYYTFETFEPNGKNIEEYSYWNNSDKPDEISTRSWNTRAKNWDLALESPDKIRLKHEVFNIQDIFSYNIQDFIISIVGEEDYFKVSNFRKEKEVPEGFSDEKGSINYWQQAVNDFWEEKNMDTDEMDIRQIIEWFDKRRKFV
jgi:hypothetical protein